MKKKRVFRQPFNFLFVLCMVFSVLSFSIPSFAVSEIPLTQVLDSSTSIKQYCCPLSFTGTFMLGTSVTFEDLSVGFNDDIAPSTPKDFSTLYRTVRLDRFNFFGFAPYDFEFTDDTSFVLQSDIHYLVSFDLELGTPTDVTANPDNVYFALYAYDNSTAGTGTQVFGSIFKSSSVSPITSTRYRYTFDFAFTEEFIARHNILAFGVVVSDLSSSVSERSIRTFIYNWDFKALDDSQYLIYRLKNPDEDMSIAVNEAQIKQEALESTEDDLLTSFDNKIDTVGIFSPSKWSEISGFFSNDSANFGKHWLDDLYSMNTNWNIIYFGVNLAFMIGMFKFLVG